MCCSRLDRLALQAIYFAHLLLLALVAFGCGDDEGTADPQADASTDGNFADRRVVDGQVVDGDGSVIGPDGGGVPLFVPDIDELDTTFGRGGLATFDTGNTSVGALWSVEVQNDGKIIAYGRNYEGMAMARVHANGQLDTSFGRGGTSYLALGQALNGFQFGTGEITQATDGKYLVAGYYNRTGSFTKAVAARLTEEGLVDSTFADQGLVFPPSTGQAGLLTSLHAWPDGKFTLAGIGIGMDVFRYSANGVLDASFGEDGLFTSVFGTTGAAPWNLTPYGEGSVIAAGQIGSSVGFVGLTPSGELDPSLGEGGVVVDSNEQTTIVRIYDAEIDAEGNIYVAASRPLADTRAAQFAVGKFDAEGNLDDTFGDGGWFLEPGDRGNAFDLEIQADGKLVVAGNAEWPERTYIGLLRLNPDGTLDETFSDDGLLTDAVNNLGIALQPDGKIVAVGGGGIQRFNPDGSEDFSTLIPVGRGVDRATAVIVQDDAKILVGGSGGIIGPGNIMRLNSDGSLDTTFGGASALVKEGVALVRGVNTLTSMQLDSKGRIVVGGIRGAYDDTYVVTRLLSNGDPDTSFGPEGTASVVIAADQRVVAHTAYVASDDSVYVLGNYAVDNVGYVAIAKFDDTGAIDATFASGGVLSMVRNLSPTTSVPEAYIRELNGGGLLIWYYGALSRVTAGGELDLTFGTEGFVSSAQPDGLVQLKDGKLLAAHVRTTGTIEKQSTLHLRRLLETGELDTSFGTEGEVTAALGINDYNWSGVPSPVGLSVDGVGNILVAAAAGTERQQHAVLLAYEADGSPLTDFGESGRLDMALSRASSALHAITFDATGRAVIAGRAWTLDGGSDFAVIRLR